MFSYHGDQIPKPYVTKGSSLLLKFSFDSLVNMDGFKATVIGKIMVVMLKMFLFFA